MAKVVKGVVSVIGAVASVLAVIPSPIQPIAAVVATVANVASTALNAIAPSKPKSTAQGSQTSFKLDPQSGIPYVIGRTLVGGNAIHRDTWGTDNEYQGFAVVWSGGGPVDAIEQFQCDQTGISFDGASKAIGGFKDFMWLKTQLGVCPSPALTSPVAGFPGWGANSKLSGYAAGVWITKFDKKGKKYAGGLPRPGAIIRGVKVYDPRQDSTYPGGSGACRALQENTYVYSENPWLHALTWALGRWQNGVKVLGVGMAVDQIAVASFVDAANIADANSWKAGGTVSSIDDKWEVLKMLAQAGGGQCIRLGAKLTALVEAPRVAIATIRETDLVGKATISATQFQRSRINGVVPIYRSEAHGWEQVPANVVRLDTHVAEDGGRRTVETELVLVQQIKQAAELVTYEIKNSREFGPIDLELKIQWLGIEPGDLVNLDIPSAGLAMQPSLALTRGLDPGTGNVALSLRSETASKHAEALGKTTTIAASPSLVPPDLSVVAAPGAGSWTVAAGLAEGTDGSSLPILIATGATDNPNASNTVFEYRPVVAPVGAMPGAPVIGQIATDATGAEFVYEAGGWARRWLMQATQDAGVTVQEFGAVTPQTSYQIAVSYVSRGVLGARLVLGPVMTGQLIASGFAGSDEFLSLVAAKSTVTFGFAFPAATDSQENDMFVHLGMNRQTYRRVAGDGFISIGGSDVTIGGQQIALCWTPADDDRIGQAILDAAGAAALADSKVQAFVTNLPSDPAPIATAQGDIWVKKHLTPVEVWVANAALTWEASATYGATNAQILDISNAQAAANTAQSNATSALTQIGAIVSDGILDKSEKPDVVLRYNAIIAEQAGIDGNAVVYGITTEKTAYDNAVAALTAYLTGLAPAYTNYAADTAITRTDFNQKFKDVYDARQAVLNKIAQIAGTRASWPSISSMPGNVNVLTGSEPIQNTQISVSGGNISGIGTGNGTTVANAAIVVNIDGTVSYYNGSTWVNLGAITITGMGGGTLAFLNNVNPATGQVLSRGSVPPAIPDNSFSYTSNTNSVTITWPAITVYLSDGTTVSISSGSQAITGLSSSTTYKVYPYVADSGGTSGTISFVTGGSGSPTAAFPSGGSAAAAASMYGRANIPMGSFLVATVASGSGGGGGGGSGWCLHPSSMVTSEAGLVRADTLKPGGRLATPEGWSPIVAIQRKRASHWIGLHCNGSDQPSLIVTPTHVLYRPDGSFVAAQAVQLGDFLSTDGDHAEVTRLELIRDIADMVIIELPEPHLYYAGTDKLLSHNAIQKP